MRTVIGLFDDRDEAMKCYNYLIEEGVARADLDILTNDDVTDQPKLAHMRTWVPEPDVNVYLEGVRQGGTLITANVADSAAARVAEIMSGFKMVNIKERAAQLQQAAPEPERARLTLSDPATNEQVLEVIEEELEVGKQQVERGRMRIYSVVTEREATQDVSLRDETIKIQRRPVNRAVSARPDLFKERSFEMVEMDEIALVNKVARVIEEVSLGKEVSEQIQTIKETLRRQDVEIEEIKALPPFETYNTDFRAFVNEKLAAKGLAWEDAVPGLKFGYQLATTEPFRSSPWNAVEADARKIWEQKNPGTWEQNKAIVHYAWEKVRSAR